MATIRRHTLKRPNGLREVDSVIDVGAGLRPFRWYEPEVHICVEPCRAYADELVRGGYSVVHQKACDALPRLKADAVYMLDVIEHMEREEGELVLEYAKSSAHCQVVVYTPHGFEHQDSDAWGMGADDWQTHRSGWDPGDFPGWKIELNGKCFFAIWDA